MLNVNLEFARGMLFVRLDGVLNKETSIKLSECLDRMIHEQEFKFYVINFENIESVDEEGIQSIIDKYYDVILNDGKLVVCGYDNRLTINLCNRDMFNVVEKASNELSALKLINI